MTSTFSTAGDAQCLLAATDPSSSTSATEGEDGSEAEANYHAYFLFHATPEQLQGVQARLHSLEDEFKWATIAVHQWEVSLTEIFQPVSTIRDQVPSIRFFRDVSPCLPMLTSIHVYIQLEHRAGRERSRLGASRAR